MKLMKESFPGVVSWVGCLLMFLASASFLRQVGLDINNPDAGLIQRLHPSFYLLTPFSILVLMAHLSGSDFSVRKSTEREGFISFSFYFYMAAVALAVACAAIGFTEASVAATASTFLLPVFVYASARLITKDGISSLRTALLLFIFANSLLGIFEKVFEYRLFEYMVGTTEKLNDNRPTAWFSHPLNNALITAIVLVGMIYSKTMERNIYYWSAVLVHVVALFCFGGRTAAVSVVLIVVVDYLVSAFKIAKSGRGVLALFGKTIGILIACIGIYWLVGVGFLDSFVQRFVDDGGSAQVRWNTINLIMDFDYIGALSGINSTSLQSLLSYYDIFNIEFSWLLIIMSHGIIVGSLLIISMIAFIRSLCGESSKSVYYMAFIFLAVTFGFTSIASLSFLLSQFIIIVYIFKDDLTGSSSVAEA